MPAASSESGPAPGLRLPASSHLCSLPAARLEWLPFPRPISKGTRLTASFVTKESKTRSQEGLPTST